MRLISLPKISLIAPTNCRRACKGKPLADATVHLYFEEGNEEGEAKTDAGGPTGYLTCEGTRD